MTLPAYDTAKMMRIADAYDAATHQPNAPAVIAAYRMLRQELDEQFATIPVLVRPTFDPTPYATSAAMFDAIDAGHPLYVYADDDGMSEDHPLYLQWSSMDGVRLSYNFVFRAVHDYYGHYKGGRNSFGPRGEYNAWLYHASMMASAGSIRALRTETIGQNAWVNFGPHRRDTNGAIIVEGEPGYLPLADRPYAPQKATLLD